MSCRVAKPVLTQLNLVVADMAATVAFYRRLGLQIDDSQPWNAHHVSIEMENGFVLDFDSVEFAKQWNGGFKGRPGGGQRVVVGFNLHSREAVDGLVAQLREAGHAIQQPPYDAFWGARYAVVEDPNGNPVGLMSPIDPQRVSEPPEM